MNEYLFQVTGMTCQKCVKAVTEAILAVDASAEVEIDLAQGEVAALSTQDAEKIRQSIENAGYPASKA